MITQLKSVQAQMLCIQYDQLVQMERHETNLDGWREDDYKVGCQVGGHIMGSYQHGIFCQQILSCT